MVYPNRPLRERIEELKAAQSQPDRLPELTPEAFLKWAKDFVKGDGTDAQAHEYVMQLAQAILDAERAA